MGRQATSVVNGTRTHALYTAGATNLNAAELDAHAASLLKEDSNRHAVEIYNAHATALVYVYHANDAAAAVANGRPIGAGASWAAVIRVLSLRGHGVGRGPQRRARPGGRARPTARR